MERYCVASDSWSNVRKRWRVEHGKSGIWRCFSAIGGGSLRQPDSQSEVTEVGVMIKIPLKHVLKAPAGPPTPLYGHNFISQSVTHILLHPAEN
jgi:hypothetical protein